MVSHHRRLRAAGNLPGAGDKTQMRDAVNKVNALRQTMPNLVVLAAHDPAAADRLAATLPQRRDAA